MPLIIPGGQAGQGCAGSVAYGLNHTKEAGCLSKTKCNIAVNGASMKSF
jgi:hypothetical protein